MIYFSSTKNYPSAPALLSIIAILHGPPVKRFARSWSKTIYAWILLSCHFLTEVGGFSLRMHILSWVMQKKKEKNPWILDNVHPQGLVGSEVEVRCSLRRGIAPSGRQLWIHPSVRSPCGQTGQKTAWGRWSACSLCPGWEPPPQRKMVDWSPVWKSWWASGSAAAAGRKLLHTELTMKLKAQATVTQWMTSCWPDVQLVTKANKPVEQERHLRTVSISWRVHLFPEIL